ncbi:accessory Sec system glycosyltransferase Asp1 [Levilactobacillus senmaizukei]|nr:accessory Sec system glycosyltransferase Asp1 [Levilactobacillus senmaizukei]
MYYFVNEYILQKNSSVEHTAMNRVRLFNHFQRPAKIVTKIYDRLLHQTLTNFGLKDDDVVNMFDFFQGTTKMAETKVMHTDDLRLPVESEVSVGANFSGVSVGDIPTGNVGFIPGTIGRVFYQEFVDSQGNAIETDLWDWRGFKSATQYFGQDGKLIMQRYYQPDGQIVLEEYFAPDTNGNPLASRMILKDYQGKGDLFFQNPDGLFEFFLAELSKQDPETTTFISDRPGTGVRPLLALNDSSRKYVYVPINHVVKQDDPIYGQLDGFLQPAFDHFNSFDGFITATPQQAADLKQRFPKANVTSISVVSTTPLVKGETSLKPMAQRLAGSLLYVGRISADKQIEQLIRMFAIIKQRVPHAIFDLYGYGEPAFMKQMTDLVNELQLQSSVTLKDYYPDIDGQYDNYQALVNLSFVDGGPMGMQEAMTHGIPAISTPFNYGPQDYIQDGVNGYLCKPGDTLAMADRIVDLFTDSKKLAKLSEGAYTTAHKNWTRQKVWNRWQKFLKD